MENNTSVQSNRQRLIKSGIIILILLILYFAGYFLFVTKFGPSLNGWLLVGQYTPIPESKTNNLTTIKPILYYINENNFSIEKIDPEKLSGINFSGLHEARAFKVENKYKIAAATYFGGYLLIFSSDDTSFKNLKLEFKDSSNQAERIRALYVGDLDGDGNDEVVMGTRASGILKYYRFENGRWTGKTIDTVGSTIHDILIVRINGRNSIFATTSVVSQDLQNADTASKTPKIIEYYLSEGKWQKNIIWESKNPKKEDEVDIHARYIFEGDFDGSKSPEIVAGIKGATGLHDLLFLKWNGTNFVEDLQNIDRDVRLDNEIIVSQDIDNDGQKEILVPSLKSEALFMFKRQGGGWKRYLLTKNILDENEKDNKIIALTVLNSSSGGYRKILIAVARDAKDDENQLPKPDEFTKFYLLTYNNKTKEWGRKLVNRISLPLIQAWGFYPISNWWATPNK